MAGLLHDKVAVITGGGSGMGRASARLFAEEGAMLVLADVNEAGGRETAAELAEAGRTAMFVRTDVSRAVEVSALIQAALAAHGRIDVLFNNAGIEGTAGVLTEDYPDDEWDRVIDVNLKGVFLGMKYGLPELVKTKGVVVNTASLAGLVGVAGMAAYTASKGGVIQLTKVAALEYAPAGVRVNCIAPGFIRTNMTARLRSQERDARLPKPARVPIGRAGTPEDIANAALYLASDLSSFVTGTVLSVDGGSLAE